MIGPSRLLVIGTFVAAVAAAPAAAWAQGQPAAATSPAAAVPAPAASADVVDRTEDPAITARARDVFQRFQSRTFDSAMLSDDYAKQLPPATIATAETQLAALGDVQKVAFDGSLKQSDVTLYVYHITTPGGVVDEIMMIDAKDKIARLAFRIHPTASPAPNAAK